MEFKELGIMPAILNALQDTGYTQPTPIQEQTIPVTLQGRDVLGLAQTGTGKTAAFAVPTLQLLATNPRKDRRRPIRALVLTPTRELGMQVYESFETYGHHLPLKSTVIFGGVGQGKQVSALRAGVEVLVATPGRLVDLINQGYVDLSSIEIFILDEADRMLDMGFIHDIRRLVKLLPKKKQTLFFSATMPKEITDIVDGLLVDPVHVSVAPVSSTVETVTQTVQYVDQVNKIHLLERFTKANPGPVLVFTRTKRGADRVVRDLMRRGVSAQAIHGNKSQNARQMALDNFKNYETQVLVATDIAARGIDINELNYVINYDMPDVPETYVHRIGRTGRAGHSGNSLSYVSYNEIPLLKDIEALTKQKITVLENLDFPLEDKTPKAKPGQGGRKSEKNPSKRDLERQEAKRAKRRRFDDSPRVESEKSAAKDNARKSNKKTDRRFSDKRFDAKGEKKYDRRDSQPAKPKKVKGTGKPKDLNMRGEARTKNASRSFAEKPFYADRKKGNGPKRGKR